MNKDKEAEAYKSGNLYPEEQTNMKLPRTCILDKVLEGAGKPPPKKRAGSVA